MLSYFKYYIIKTQQARKSIVLKLSAKRSGYYGAERAQNGVIGAER